MKIDLLTYLSLVAYSKDNAIKAKELANSLNISTRELRALRAENNKTNNDKIISDYRGFYIPSREDKEEIKKCAYVKIKAGVSLIKEARELFKFYNLDETLKINFDTLEIKENKIGGEQDVQ